MSNFLHFSQAQFKELLYDLWFNAGNTTIENPSAFQKVFAGEIVNNPYKLSVRNWIQFYILESKGLNYFGYIRHYPYEVSLEILGHIYVIILFLHSNILI